MSNINGWKESSLPSLLKVMKSGGTPSTSRSDFYGGEIPFVAIEDMTSCSKYLSLTQKTITALGLKNSNTWLVPEDAILYSIYATLGIPRINIVPVATNQAILALICDLQKINNDFLFYWLDYIRDSVVNINSSQTTQKNLSATVVKTFSVYHPTDINEQAKIAEVLSTVDKAISETEALIAKQQRIKTGLMQDLLTRGIDEKGNLRSEETHQFKDSPLGRIPVEWETKFLEKFSSDIVDCPHTTPNFIAGGILVARTFNIKDGRLASPFSYVSKSEYHSRTSRLEPKEGDIIFTREAPVGEAFIIPKNLKICLGQRTMLIRTLKEKLLADYLLEVIYSKEMKIYFDKIVGGTTNPHLNVSDVRNLLIRVPEIKEQTAITQCLKSIRKSITNAEENLNKLYSLKTALMQDLLTGKKRVTPLLENSPIP